MPLPVPGKNETKQQFISRCMAEMTLSESERFPDHARRAAICYFRWDQTPQEKRQAVKRKKPEAFD